MFVKGTTLTIRSCRSVLQGTSGILLSFRRFVSCGQGTIEDA